MAEETYHTVGKRKSAVARVWLKPGSGRITINKKPMDEFITRETDKLIIRHPLELTDTLNKYFCMIRIKSYFMKNRMFFITVVFY